MSLAALPDEAGLGRERIVPEFLGGRCVDGGMKRLRLVVLAFLFFLALPVAASHADLRSLTHDLDTALAASPLDASSEARVRAHLEDAIGIVRTAGTVDVRCLDVVGPVYQKAYIPTEAIRMAATLCRTSIDVDVLRVANDVFSKIYVPLDALRLAADYARRPDLRGKADILLFANQKFATVYVPADALRLAATFAATAPRGSAPCIERAFTIYRSSFYLHDALRLSADLCTR